MLQNVPSCERDLYLNTTLKAVECAQRGHVVLGFTEIWHGVARAEAAAEDGEPWAEVLRTAYQQAANRYTQQYGATLLG